MNSVEPQVKELVESELLAANVKFPQFNSEHEGFSVIHEEFDELMEEIQVMSDGVADMWGKIKKNQLNSTCVVINYNTAVNAACEAIQLAAMCRKMQDFMEKKGKEGKDNG